MVILGLLVPPGGKKWYRTHEPLDKWDSLGPGRLGGEVEALHLATVSIC